MWDGKHYVLWQHIVQMFYQDLESGLKLLPRITADHIKLNAYSTMRVNLAAQVLSSSVSAVLTAFGTPDTAGTAKLCKMVDSFFDCLNVRCTHEHERKKKTFLAPYTTIEDPRFAWLEGEFLQYLNDWK